MVCESRLSYGAEMWTLEDGWKETDVIQGRFYKEVLCQSIQGSRSDGTTLR
jgi:hypothetical protein